MERSGKNTYLNWKVLIFSFAILALACSPMLKGKAKIITITPLSCQLASIELQKVDFLYEINVTNPFDEDITITNMVYQFYINDELVSEGDFIERPTNVRANSTRKLQKFIPVTEEKQSESVKRAIRERKGYYTLTLKMAYKTATKGTVETERILKLRIQ